MYARIFAATYRQETAGAVLVEPFAPDISPRERAGVTLDPALDAEWNAGLRATFAQIEALEGLDWAATERELEAAHLGDLPLELIFVDQRLRYDERVDPTTRDRLIAAWQDLVLGWSSDARLTIATDSRHIVQLDRPDVVVAAIRRLVDRARTAGSEYP